MLEVAGAGVSTIYVTSLGRALWFFRARAEGWFAKLGLYAWAHRRTRCLWCHARWPCHALDCPYGDEATNEKLKVRFTNTAFSVALRFGPAEARAIVEESIERVMESTKEDASLLRSGWPR